MEATRSGSGFEAAPLASEGAADGELLLVTEYVDAEVLELDQELQVEPEPAPRKVSPFVKIQPGARPAFAPVSASRAVSEASLPRMMPQAWQQVQSVTRAELETHLEEARNLVALARRNEDRSAAALYQGVSSAYDLALAAQASPGEFSALLARAGIATQERAPMTPLVKLVFGQGYDKTRLAEYAAALDHARRLQLGRGQLGAYLAEVTGGLKGVVHAERVLRRQEQGTSRSQRTGPREAMARTLRAMPTRGFSEIAAEGDEFVLLLARRLPGGGVALVDEVPRDLSLLDRAVSAIVRKLD